MPVKAAMIQFHDNTDKEKNVQTALRLVREAAGNGAQVVCLHELFNTHYFCLRTDANYYDLAETIPGPTIERMAALAKEESIVLIVPIYELDPRESVLYNSATVLGPDGKILGKYRKTNIPLIVTKGLSSNEKFYFKPGNLGFPVFQTPLGLNIGILICYDRHFPEGARILGLNGADVIFVPTATGGPTRYIWELELKAHAVSNIFYVGGVNKVGPDAGGTGFSFHGASVFISPKGETLSQASEADEEIIYAEIDRDQVTELRRFWMFYRDRRPDLYHRLTV